MSQVFRVSYKARILCAHLQRDAACGNKLTQAARVATWARCPSTPGALTGPLFPSATSSRRQKCPPLIPGGPAGEGHALLPASSRGAGTAARVRARDERKASDAPRPPGRLNLEDMAALWCPGQVLAVRCLYWPALLSYTHPRTPSDISIVKQRCLTIFDSCNPPGGGCKNS